MKPLIVAHRGASADAPENTLAAFRLAWEHGADAIEGDFRLTADGHWVCVHDPTLLRTAGADVRVADLTFAEIRRFNIGRWKDDRVAEQHVPSLHEVLSTVPRGKQLFLEVKSSTDEIDSLRWLLDAHERVREAVRVISFDKPVIKAAKTIPGVRAHWLVGFDPEGRDEWLGVDAILSRLAEIDADGVGVQANIDAVDAAFIDAVHAAGREVHGWTVDDERIARHFAALGVESITTNRPKAIRAALD